MLDPSLFPPGVMRSLVFHWTAGNYRAAYPAYHFCVGLDGEESVAVLSTGDIAANMRDVREPGEPYCAHTSGRNSHAIGLAICAMEGATPADFGRYPLRDDFVDAACAAAARLCAFYGIPVDASHVYTHAEAAVEDGYFGSGDGERWDIARLAPSSAALAAGEALAVGDELRRRVRMSASGAPSRARE